MLNAIWVIMIFSGIVTGLITGRTKEVSEAIRQAAVKGEPDHRHAWSHVPLDRSYEGCGKSGIVDTLAKTLERCLRFLFRESQRDIRPMVL